MADGKQSIWRNPWTQLIVGVICMATIANLQYGWGAFVKPIDAKFHWGLPAIQVATTIFAVLQTWLVPVVGWFADRHGPRLTVSSGGLLCGLGWVLHSNADSLPMLYLAAAVSGMGAGAVYGSCIGNAVKWLPAHRGFAAGLTAAGFGIGAAFTVAPITAMIKADGFEAAFLFFGVGQGLIVMILGLILELPPAAITEQELPTATPYNARPMEVLHEPAFWMMYLMFVLTVAGGLMATVQLPLLAKEFGLNKVPLAFFTAVPVMAAAFAKDVGSLMNGLTRPIFGWISDRFGRERTMGLAFGLEAVAIVLMANFGQDPVAFVALTAMMFFCWGEVYALFPATCADTFGSRHATTNTGMLYTAKGTANLVIPFGAVIISAAGDWSALFYLTAAMNATAAVLALWVLRPMRANLQAKYAALHSARQRR